MEEEPPGRSLVTATKEGVGRVALAARDLPPGHLVLTEAPAVVGPR